ncbi:TetR/AcrR family transcriptional regulator [Desmospora activa]|uniref:TetR family transcriptional regulator n=1 Tax=Desmospora activa DSM 45169 TaxID=1121389 RepID=A0A2T4Z0S0_9BACL|nr:TetR/AcrR family transcriptional regulator [Desmospora activa]PTM53337.1 TetR family transcriptional regulator [Desmospora activa DSM 45169]
MGDQPSFIAEARREQIIKASIEALNELGYANISLAKIAKKAKVSTGLISYHFSDKEDLLNNTLTYLLKKQFQYIMERVSQKDSAYDQLIAFIDASLAYQGTHHAHNVALIEIVFNARTSDNVPYYQVSTDEEDPLYVRLQEILRYGQETKGFSGFDPQNVSIMIQGAIGESMLMKGEGFDLEAYRDELVSMVTKMVKS